MERHNLKDGGILCFDVLNYSFSEKQEQVPDFFADSTMKLTDLADQGNDIVAGVCYSKQIPPQPILFKGRGTGSFKDWKVGDILYNLDGVGMGLTLIRTNIFRKIKKPWFKTITSQGANIGGKYASYSKDEAL